MKKLALTLLFTINAGVASLSAQVPFTYSDFRDVDSVGVLLSNSGEEGSSSYAMGVFDIVAADGDSFSWDRPGFDPESMVVSGAEVAVGFFDVQEDSTTFLGYYMVQLGENFSAIAPAAVDPATVSEFELSLETSSLGEITGDLLLDLQEDGMLSWRVDLDENFSGAVTLWWAALAADAYSVPDTGSTAAFLGLAVFVFAFVQRRIRAS